MLNFIKSSKKNGDYNSCDAELLDNHCTKCDENDHKTLKTNLSGSYCYCSPGYIEVL